jgi:hypothetical protein
MHEFGDHDDVDNCVDILPRWVQEWGAETSSKIGHDRARVLPHVDGVLSISFWLKNLSSRLALKLAMNQVLSSRSLMAS